LGEQEQNKPVDEPIYNFNEYNQLSEEHLESIRYQATYYKFNILLVYVSLIGDAFVVI
jgi:hypothetical protein